MKNFTEWLEPEKPKGLEGIKQKLSEAYREFGDQATSRPQRRPQPKPQQSAPAPKADEFAGFAGMEPAKLDALRGLAGNQPNPGARAKFIQNALANFQKQQAKPAEAPAPEPKSEPAPEKPKLSLKPDTKLSTKPKATAPEPEDEDKVDPDLERRAMAKIADIRNPKAKRKAKGKKKTNAPAPITEMGDYMDGFDETEISKNPTVNDLMKMARHFRKKDWDEGWFINEGQRRGASQLEDVLSNWSDESITGMSDIEQIADRSLLNLKSKRQGQFLHPKLKEAAGMKIPIWEELLSLNDEGVQSRFSGIHEDALKGSRMFDFSDDDLKKQWDRISQKNGSPISKVIDLFGKGGWSRNGASEEAFKKRYGDDYQSKLEERAFKMFRQYMRQGGRDGWLGTKNTLPLPFEMMGADHISEAENEGFWREYAMKNGLDQDDWRFIADDPDHNIMLTRSNLNKQVKGNLSIREFRDNLMEKLGDGSEEAKNNHYEKLRSSYGKSKTRQLRDQLHHIPMIEKIRDAINEGRMDPDTYDEIVKIYQQGRSEILGTDNMTGDFSEQLADLKNRAMDYNDKTDPFRMMGEAISRSQGGQNFGVMANEMVRKNTPAQTADWYGFGLGTSPSNATMTGQKHPVVGREIGEYIQHALSHPSLDYYKDVMYQLALQGDGELANNYHSLIRLVGNSLAAGGSIGTKDWATVVKKLAQHARGKVKNFKENFDLESESTAHNTELARRVLDKNYMPNGIPVPNEDGVVDNVIPARDKLGVDALFGEGYQYDKASSIVDFIKTIADETNVMQILGNPAIFGSKMLENLTDTPKSFIIDGKIQLS